MKRIEKKPPDQERSRSQGPKGLLTYAQAAALGMDRTSREKREWEEAHKFPGSGGPKRLLTGAEAAALEREELWAERERNRAARQALMTQRQALSATDDLMYQGFTGPMAEEILAAQQAEETRLAGQYRDRLGLGIQSIDQTLGAGAGQSSVSLRLTAPFEKGA